MVAAPAYDLRPCDVGVVAALVERFHGYGSMSATATYAFAVYEDEMPVAAFAWQPPPFGAAKSVCESAHGGVLALSRMVAVPREDRVLRHISKPLRAQMRRIIDRGRWPALVTFSDEGQGHTGHVYKCSGWQKTKRARVPFWTNAEGKRASPYSNGRYGGRDLIRGGIPSFSDGSTSRATRRECRSGWPLTGGAGWPFQARRGSQATRLFGGSRARMSMGRFQNRKGNRGELEVARLLEPYFPLARRRTKGEERQDGKPGRDIEGVPGYCIQVQLAASPTPEKKYHEAKNAAREGEIAVAFTRRSADHETGEWLVTMRWQDFSRLLPLKAIVQMPAQETKANGS